MKWIKEGVEEKCWLSRKRPCHRFRQLGLVTVCVKPGFVRTSMTAELEPPPFAGEPEGVAKRVVRALEQGWPVVYAPPVWRLVLAIIRRLPRAVMRRLSF